MIVGGKTLPAEVGKSQPKPRSAADVIGEMARVQNELAERNQRAEMEGMSAEEMFQRGYKHWLLRLMYARHSVAWTREFTEGDKWIRCAAERGNADAQFLCGFWEENDARRVEWHRRAAEQGHIEAMRLIRGAYEDGRRVPQNRTEAEKWGKRLSQALGGGIPIGGRDSPEKKRARAEACEECRNLAVRGNIGAQYAFHLMGEFGDPEGVKWLRRAAEQGVAEAQKDLGEILHADLRTREEGLKWLRRAAEQGDAEVQKDLAQRLESYTFLGQRLVRAPNFQEAAKWYRRAAEQGDATAQNALGGLYFEGSGVPQDYSEAVKWYRLAAAQGHAPAQYNLGDMFVHGACVARDDAEAEKWIKWREKWGEEWKKQGEKFGARMG